ncbi:MAG: 3'(2'),5'-bisphosphate nucleotidase CysQ, partial [Lewinella sp.]|nr:3'(2'),5'-bisphosphate nucleotidase CysQ [Lewinella sp.]
DFPQLARQVGEIARRAGDAIMTIYENEADFGVETKADDSPLTRADQASNAVINEGLEALAFQAPIVSEENKEVPYPVRKDYRHFWLVDPLDGTKEFIKRNGEFTVNIALVEGQSVVLGVVYVPVTKELYWAAKGHGAHYIGETEKNLTTARFSLRDPGLKVVASRSHLNDETKAYVADLNQPDFVSKGSSLKLLLVAAGEAHLYPRLAPTMEWDTGAAQIIVEEAGGTVLQAGKDEPVRYNKEVLLNPHFIAAGRIK